MKLNPLYEASRNKNRDGVKLKNYEELRLLAEVPGLFHIPMYFDRPGALWFAAKLEHEHFVPGTPENDQYELMFLEWPKEDPHYWAVITIPLAKRHLAERVAGEIGMRLANGVPTIFNPIPGQDRIVGIASTRPDAEKRLGIKVVERFPMDNDRVCTLENDKNSDFHKSDIGKLEMIRREQEETDRIFENAKRRRF